MSAKLLIFLAGLTVFGAAVAQEATTDENTLAQLVKAGSNLSKPHEIDHWLYFKSQRDAETAAKELQNKGFSAVSVAASRHEWRVKAHNRLVPSHAAVAANTALLESVASTNSGEYDGWETQVVE